MTKWQGHIHPLIDMDLIDKMSSPDLVSMGNLVVGILNEKLPGTAWKFYTRPGAGGGIHLFPINACVENKQYIKLCEFVQQTVLIAGWKIDCPRTVTLPGCGKKNRYEFVYKDLAYKFEPFPLCQDGCAPIDPNLFINTYGGGVDVADGGATDKSARLNMQSEHQFMEQYIMRLYEMAKPEVCKMDTAILYRITHEECPDDLEEAEYYRTADLALSKLDTKSWEEVRYATISDMLRRESIGFLPLAQKNRFLEMSQCLVDEIDDTGNNPLLKIELLISLSYPILRMSGDILLIFTKHGWQAETKDSVMSRFKTYLKILGARTKLKFYGRFTPKDLLDFTISLWAFKLDMRGVNANQFAYTCDGKLFMKDCTLAVDSTVMYSYFFKNALYFTVAELQKVIGDVTRLQDRIHDIFQKSELIHNGTLSFMEVFEEADFLKCPIYSSIYFLMTFLMFNTKRMYQFLTLFRNILFGLQKRVVIMVGQSGNNGKTTFGKVLKFAFGDGCGVYNSSEMSSKVLHPTAPSFVHNASKKITFIDETGNMDINVNLLKRLTSGGYASERALFDNGNEPLTCLTNFLGMGNSKPNMYMDTAFSKRIVFFDANTEFVLNDDPDVLVRKKEYGPKPIISILPDIRSELLGLGLIGLLLALPDIEKYGGPLEKDSSLFLESPLQGFTRLYIQTDDEYGVLPFDRLKTAIAHFATIEGVDEAQLLAHFKEVYGPKQFGNGYNGICLRWDAPSVLND